MSGTLAFHYGNFDNHYGDDTRANAAKNGRIYSDTLTSEIPAEFGTFTMSGTSSNQTTYSWTPKTTAVADVLVVAGGGGGGGTIGGGGGAGGLIYKTNQAINPTSSYTIKVGDGGQGGNGWNISTTVGKPGYDSVYGTYTAVGGGGGYSYDYTTSPNGGSGGGSANESATGGTGNQPSGYGNDGGSGGNTNFGGGGGGALSKGGPVISTTNGGVGGVGMDLSYRYGSNYGHDGWFSGGGGGAVRYDGTRVPGVGGKGGGGDATAKTEKAEDGREHSGGGGGGGGYNGGASGSIIGGHGGSGIVLIGYKYTAESPASISGLVGWYTAYSAELSSGSVNKWNDLSGNENHVESGSFTGSVKRADPNDSSVTNRTGVELDYFGNRTIAFTYGNFNSTLGHTNVESAAKAGVICANTSASEIPPHFGTFTMSGTVSGQTTYSWTPPGDCVAEVLVVAGGGGGGGSPHASGGGGGGLILRPNVFVKGKDNTVKVGDGGSGGTGMITSPWTGQRGSYGKNSIFNDLTAVGGGGGGRYNNQIGLDGGSGGGSEYRSTVAGSGTQSSQSGDSGTYGYGNNGAVATTNYRSGGGGGAGGAGISNEGNGGIGKYIDFARNYGDDGWFSGGGGGGVYYDGGIYGGNTERTQGGLGGGGTGGTQEGNDGNGENGQVHTGGGGGGAERSQQGTGGNGGSGIVIVKFSLLHGKGPTAFPFLYGTTTDGLQFPTSVMDTSSDYTLFHVARYYNPTGSPTRKRIFDGVTSNWLSGFYDGKSGIAYHNGWLTQQVNRHGDNWLISTDQKDLYRSNGVDRTVSGSGSTSRQLSINYGYYTGERSDWAVAEVIVYNRELSSSEYLSIESYLTSKYFRNDIIASSGEISGMLVNSTFYNGHQSTTASTGYPISLARLGTRIGNTLNTLLNSSDFRNLRVSGALDSLSTSLLPAVAFGFRKLLGSYTGPQARIRRSSDNVEADLYMDSSGTITLISGTTETNYSTWLNGATGYLVTWYDQSGGGRHAVRTRRSTSYTWPPVKKDSGDSTLHMEILPADANFVEFDNANLGTHDYTWIMAVQTPSATSRWRTYLRGASKHHYLLLQSGGTLVGFYDNTSGGFSNTGVSHTPGNKDVYSSYATGGQTVIRHNGNAGNTINKQLPDFWNQRMMLTYPGQGGGKIFEMIFYAGAQSVSFVTSVEAIVDDVL
jgi:hypothetical protein